MKLATVITAALLFIPMLAQAEESALQPAKKTTTTPAAPRGPRMSLDVTRGDLTRVLKKIGAAMKVNIYIGSEVKGEVTLSARDVPAEGLLALVLKMQPEQYEYKLVGNTLIVGAPDRVNSIPSNIMSR